MIHFDQQREWQDWIDRHDQPKKWIFYFEEILPFKNQNLKKNGNEYASKHNGGKIDEWNPKQGTENEGGDDTLENNFHETTLTQPFDTPGSLRSLGTQGERGEITTL